MNKREKAMQRCFFEKLITENPLARLMKKKSKKHKLPLSEMKQGLIDPIDIKSDNMVVFQTTYANNLMT